MVDITMPSNSFNQTAFVYEQPNFDCGCNESVKTEPIVNKKCSCSDCGCSKKTDKPVDNKGGTLDPLNLPKEFTITLNRDFLVYAAIGVAVILILK